MGQLVAERASINSEIINYELEDMLKKELEHFRSLKAEISKVYCNSYRKTWEALKATLPKKQAAALQTEFDQIANPEHDENAKYYKEKVKMFCDLALTSEKKLVQVVDSMYADMKLAKDEFYKVLNHQADKENGTISVDELAYVLINLENMHVMCDAFLHVIRHCQTVNENAINDKKAAKEEAKRQKELEKKQAEERRFVSFEEWEEAHHNEVLLKMEKLNYMALKRQKNINTSIFVPDDEMHQ